MRLITLIMADLVATPLGRRSRLADEIAGMTVLRRTVSRVLAASRAGSVVVGCPPRDAAAIRALLDGLTVRVETYDLAPPYAAIVRHARHWGLDGWRGGIGSMCWFDEEVHTPLAALLATRASADGVIIVPASAVLMSPGLIDAMAEHFERVSPLFPLTFCTAPPGLAPAILTTALLRDLAPTGQPPGIVLAYRPDSPAPDLTGKDACFRPPAAVAEARGRLLADTSRGCERITALLQAGAADWSVERIAAWLHAGGNTGGEEGTSAGVPPATSVIPWRPATVSGEPEQQGAIAGWKPAPQAPAPVVEEIEIELTTDDPLAGRTQMRPQAPERRGPLAAAHVARIAEFLRGRDDVRIVLGGFGEPLLHPEFRAVAQAVREAGALSIAVRTCGRAGDETQDAALFDVPVDALLVTLDAATPETYQRVHGTDGYDAVVGRIERWLARRVERKQVTPLIVPQFTKCVHNLADMEAFFDYWHRRLGWAVITGCTHAAGQRPDLRVMPMAPPKRVPCRRLLTRMMVLADGRVVACDQDYAARQPLGSLSSQSLADIWRRGVGDLRAAHQAGRYTDHPLCPACDEWHRP